MGKVPLELRVVEFSGISLGSPGVMPLPKIVYQALKDGSGSAGTSVRQISHASGASQSAFSSRPPASGRHGEKLKRFLAAVKHRPEHFELYISKLRLETLSEDPDVPLAKPCLLIGTQPELALAKPCLLISSKGRIPELDRVFVRSTFLETF